MKEKIKFPVVLSLILILILFNTCKRKGIEEPSPLGPSSISILLNVSVNPNVLHAGKSRGKSVVTATLKKFDGTPLGNRTVYFYVDDGFGNPISIGYFEGNRTVKTKNTDGNGVVSVNYYGPLDKELSGSIRIYIRAKATWEGRQFVSELSPLDIIGEGFEERILNIYAVPTTLYAGTTREMSLIKATLKTASGTPIANRTLRFEIVDAEGNSTYVGYFSGKKQVEFKVTDVNGRAQVDYYGPLAAEIGKQNTTVYIRATVEGETTSSTVPIYIYVDGTEAILNVSADPAFINAGATRETSEITATLTELDGTPIANKILLFEIVDSSGNTIYTGYFEDNQNKIAIATDANGVAQVTYYGPLASEIPAVAVGTTTTVYIRATADWGGGESDTAMIPIQITKL